MKTKEETTAQEALRLLKRVPAKQWCTGVFVKREEKQCCAIGHYHRLKNNKGSFEFDSYDVQEGDLRNASFQFIKTKYGQFTDVAGVNNRKIWSKPDFNKIQTQTHEQPNNNLRRRNGSIYVEAIQT